MIAPKGGKDLKKMKIKDLYDVLMNGEKFVLYSNFHNYKKFIKGKKEDELKAYLNEEIEAVSSDNKSALLFIRYKGI